MYVYDVRISGKGFAPSKSLILSDYNVEDSNDAGWINRSGKVIEDGHLRIKGDGILELCKIAETIKNTDPNVTEIQFWLGRFYKDQCNLEFSSDELKYMSELNGILCVSCYQDDEIED